MVCRAYLRLGPLGDAIGLTLKDYGRPWALKGPRGVDERRISDGAWSAMRAEHRSVPITMAAHTHPHGPRSHRKLLVNHGLVGITQCALLVQ